VWSGTAVAEMEVELPGTSSVDTPVTIDMWADSSRVRAGTGAEVCVRATLRRADGGSVSVPTPVVFGTDLGEITARAMSEAATGTAAARFRADAVGTAHITATAGDAVGRIEIAVVPGPPAFIHLACEPREVGIQGSGKSTSTVVRATLADDQSYPVEDGTLVRFEIVGAADPLASLYPSPAGAPRVGEPVPTRNGVAWVTFRAGTTAGPVRIRATVVDAAGEPVLPLVACESTELVVHSGPPYVDMSDPADPFTEARITLAASMLNVYAGELNTENSRSQITVLVADRYGNPVPPGTAVWFTTTGGVITTSAGYVQTSTSAEGVATAVLYAGNPLPTRSNSRFLANPNYATHGGPQVFDIAQYLLAQGYGDFDYDGDYNEGIAIVSAQTLGLDHAGNQAVVWNCMPVVFSRPVAVFDIRPDVGEIAIGQTARFTVVVQDRNGNPVVGGSTLAFSSQHGRLSTENIVTRSPGTTRYYVDLANDLDPASATTTSAVVEVRLSSVNGDMTALSPPVVLKGSAGQ